MKNFNTGVIEIDTRDRNFTLHQRNQDNEVKKTPNEFSGTLNEKLIKPIN